MKNKKGNAAVIAIIIVIVAITAGIVGWMFAKKSQAPDQQKVATQPTSITKQTTLIPAPVGQPAPTTPTIPSTQSYIEVKELGFKIPIDPAMASDLTYKVNAVGGSVTFSSKSLTAVNNVCGDGSSGAVITKIQGSPSAPKGPLAGESSFYQARISDIKQFDGFFFFYQGPQDSCTDGKNIALEGDVYQSVIDGFKNISLITK
ncbi:MAG: hypothetical protein PHP62_05775 [Candidatus Moranbacteria bacterium]|nr:hypothetical protein [Candidatus Moranbacteria bacterium]